MKIEEVVKECNRIAISGHENPDGDCVGSCMGMALYLRKMMPGKQIDVFLEPFGSALQRNIPGTETIRYDAADVEESYDAFICLDSDSKRIGAAEHIFDNAKVHINIDHHISNPGCGDHNYIDGKASSACELVYKTMEAERVDEKIARALYVGMMTDTGVFRFSNTSEETMQIAGRLMSYGFDFPSIVREVYYERTFAAAKALGAALTASKLDRSGKVVTSVLNAEQLEVCGATRKDLDGVSSQLVQTEGVDCSMFFHEIQPGVYKGSLRSNNLINVAEIASVYGGGGHVRAAGCTVDPGALGMTIDALIATMVEAAGKQLVGKE